MHKKLLSINKIKNYIIIFLLISLVILSYLNFHTSKETAIQSIQDKNLVLLNGVINYVENYICERLCDFENLSISKKNDLENLYKNLSKIYEFKNRYEAIFVIDSNLNQTFSVDSKNFENYKDSLVKYINKSSETNSTVIGDIIKSDNGILFMPIVVPVFLNEELYGYIISNVNWNTLGSDLLYNQFLSSDNTFFGIDKNGIRVFSLFDSLVGTDSLNEFLLDDVAYNNYKRMSLGISFAGKHHNMFNVANPNEVYNKPVERLLVAKPVIVNNEFKFSLGITSPYSVTSFFEKFILRQLILFIFLIIVCLYYIYNLYDSYMEKLKLEKSLFESQESEKIKTEFFCNISHELRTPLTVILSGMHLIYVKYSDKFDKYKDLEKLYKRIKQNALRLLKTINNLLELSKIDSNYLVLNFSNLNIISTVQNIVMSIVPYADNKEIEISFNSSLKEKIISADKDSIEKMVLNLLSNAIKFTPSKGKISVDITQDVKFVKISVKDTGIGIPKDKQASLFKRFFQADASLKRSFEGSGLGLSIVKSLVDMHEGRIEVKSEEHMGTEFIIYLPDRVLGSLYVEEDSASYQSFINPVDIELSDL